MRHVAAVLCILFTSVALIVAQDMGQHPLLQKVDTIRAPADSFAFNLEVTGPKGQRLGMHVRVRNQVRSLVRYTAPRKAKGRALLLVERNLWIYIPGSRRALRISPQQQVLGGVASADIARTVYHLDYAVEAVMQLDPVAGESRRRLKLVSATKGAAYARIDLEVAGEEARPLKAVFFSASNRTLKTSYFEAYRDILGRSRPTVLRVVDHLDGNAETVMRYTDYEITDTPAIWFQPAYLKRLR
ncbi:hypothetical protein NKDENANG_03618 [Candidatus Entotheonellaceae bacterium PAL068K]